MSTCKAFASQDTPNGPLSKVRRTLIAWPDLRASSKLSPIALSEAILLNPSSDLSQPGVAPLMKALITEGAPNALAMLQTKPAGPLSPSASVSAMSDPMRVVKAANGTRLFPKLMEWTPRSSEVAEVEFDMVSGWWEPVQVSNHTLLHWHIAVHIWITASLGNVLVIHIWITVPVSRRRDATAWMGADSCCRIFPT